MVRKLFSCLLLATLTLLVVASCGDDPSNPGGTGGSQATLESIWPNLDGTEWHYEWKLRVYEEHDVVTYPSEDFVPEIPSWEDAYTALTADGSGAPVSLGQQFYELAFSGRDTTASGCNTNRACNIDHSCKRRNHVYELQATTTLLHFVIDPADSHGVVRRG